MNITEANAVNLALRLILDPPQHGSAIDVTRATDTLAELADRAYKPLAAGYGSDDVQTRLPAALERMLAKPAEWVNVTAENLLVPLAERWEERARAFADSDEPGLADVALGYLSAAHELRVLVQGVTR